jgi:hypothetical protein
LRTRLRFWRLTPDCARPCFITRSIGGTYLCKATDGAPVNGNCNKDNAAVWGVTK